MVSKRRTGAWPKNGISVACPGPDRLPIVHNTPSSAQAIWIASLSPLFPGKGREQCACLHTQRERRALKLHFPLFDLDVLIPAHKQCRNERFRNTHPPSPFPPRLGLGLMLRFTFGTILNPALTAGSMRGCLRPIRNKRERLG